VITWYDSVGVDLSMISLSSRRAKGVVFSHRRGASPSW
jgi:hypothetical protein